MFNACTKHDIAEFKTSNKMLTINKQILNIPFKLEQNNLNA